MNLADLQTFMQEDDSGLAMVKMISGMYTKLASILDPEIVKVEGKSYSKSSPKACFANSEQYTRENPKSSYVLGYLLYQGIPIEHAWVFENGKYLDVTLDGTSESEVYVKCAVLTSSELSELTKRYTASVKAKKLQIGYIDLVTLNRYQ